MTEAAADGGLWPVVEAHGAELYLGHHAALAELVRGRGGCDALVTDPPFSARTHGGHEEGRLIAKRAKDFGDSLKREATSVDDRARARYEAKGRAERRALDYAAWSDVDMIKFLRLWGPLTRGWVCVLTDHVLAVVVEAELGAQGRLVFPPVPCIDPGGRVRFSGDGPGSTTCYLVVARPRREPYSKWGALPGYYLTPPGYYLTPPGYNERGHKLRDRVVGAKNAWLMQSLVEHYSRRGDLVVDPCAGGGTTLRACQALDRRALGGELDPKTAVQAGKALARAVQAPLVYPMPSGAEKRAKRTTIVAAQGALFG